MKKAILPPIKTIVNYWSCHIDETFLGVDFAEGHERCWRCGYKTRTLHRCHIVPECLGGGCKPSNLIILCGQCHVQAPNIIDEYFIFPWLNLTKGSDFYEDNTSFINDNLFELLFKRKFIKDLLVFNKKTSQIEIDEIETILNEQFCVFTKQTARHFTQGTRNNNSTRAWVQAKAEEHLIQKLKLNTPKGFIKVEDLKLKIFPKKHNTKSKTKPLNNVLTFKYEKS